MTSERIKRQIDGLLDDASAAFGARDFERVRELCDLVLRLDASNEDARTYIEATGTDTGLAIESAQMPAAEGESRSAPTIEVVTGADGCPAGWVAVSRHLDTGAIDARVYEAASELIAESRREQPLFIDIPIGLVETGQRTCDVEARRLLGPGRSSSVFPAPLRPALAATTYQEASAISNAVSGARISKQSWGIFPKVQEVDAVLAANPELQGWVREVHPELCFWKMNEEEAMEHSKRTAEGRITRSELVAAHFGPEAFTNVRRRFRRGDVADDDLLDAFATLYTAERAAAGTAQTVPSAPPLDERGLRMEMVY